MDGRMGFEIKNFDGINYIFMTNYEIKQEPHILKALELSGINEYLITEAYDIMNRPLADNKALWMPEKLVEKNDLFFQTSLILHSRLKDALIKNGYDVKNLSIYDCYYGMDLHSLPKLASN